MSVCLSVCLVSFALCALPPFLAGHPFRSQRAGGGGGDKGAPEWEGGVHRRVERRRRRSGSELSQRGRPSFDDDEGGESSASRDEHRSGNRNGGAEQKGSVDGSGDGDGDTGMSAKAAAGALAHVGPSDAVGTEDAAAVAAAGVAERGNADDGDESDRGRGLAAGQQQQKSVPSRARSGRGGERRSRRRDGGGAAGGGGGSGGARRHSDGGRYMRDSSRYPAIGVAHQATGFGYPPGGVVDPRFAPPAAPIGCAPGSSPYMMPPPPHGMYLEAADWAAGGLHHPGRTPAQPPSHHRLQPYEGGNVSRRRKTRSPGPDPAGGEKRASVGGRGGFAERGGGGRSRSRSGSWDSEDMVE